MFPRYQPDPKGAALSSHALVRVILRSKATIDSPILDHSQAAQDLEAINGAREQTEEIKLPWISVFGGDVEAAHLVERAAPRSSARERLS
jgi:hypothetical protein